MSPPDPENEHRDNASRSNEKPPATVLDSILRDDGPLPPARIRLRALAFILDFILVTAIASVIIWKIVLPRTHPAALNEMNEWTEAFVASFDDQSGAESSELPGMSESLKEALTYARDMQLLIFWIYFAVGEAFFAGSSLGKRACRLRTISTVTLDKPPVLSGVVRGGLKTVALFFIFPLAFLATIGALFFNKRRQTGHDLLSRTAVIDEKFVKTDISV
ncbi:MAG: RDD family protein [Opitutales bacterium]